MIKQFLDYKKESVELALHSVLLSEEQKKRSYEDYVALIQAIFSGENSNKFMVNLNFSHEFMRFVYDRKIPLVMDSLDLQVELDNDMPNCMGDKYRFHGIDDFIAIHKSPVMPTNDTILTPESGGLTNSIKFIDPSTGIAHETKYLVGNDTIHFTLNCPVSNHLVGNDWNNYPYAIMTSFQNLNREKVVDVKTEDTFVDGDAKLNGNYFIFCPFGEREKVQENNPNSIVIEYKDISLNDAISMMIILSGKKLEKYGAFGWNKNFEFSGVSSDLLEAEKIIEKNGYPVLQGDFGRALHSETKYMSRRMWKREYRALISLLEYNKKHDIEMPDEVVNMLLLYNGAYSLPGNVPVSIDLFKEYVIPILNESGYQVDDSLFSGIEEKGENLKIIDTTSAEIPLVQCPGWENELRNRVISVIKGKELVSDTENTAITKK